MKANRHVFICISVTFSYSQYFAPTQHNNWYYIPVAKLIFSGCWTMGQFGSSFWPRPLFLIVLATDNLNCASTWDHPGQVIVPVLEDNNLVYVECANFHYVIVWCGVISWAIILAHFQSCLINLTWSYPHLPGNGEITTSLFKNNVLLILYYWKFTCIWTQNVLAQCRPRNKIVTSV